MARRAARGRAGGRRGKAGELAQVPSGQRTTAALARATEDLRSLGTPFALIGGFAIAARAEPRLTRDVDFVVAVDTEADAEQVVHDLLGLGYCVESLLEHAPTGRLATVRLRSPSGLLVDLLFASSGVEPEVAAGATLTDVLGPASVPVARVGHLLALKVLSRDDRRRPQDHDDLHALLDVADAKERRVAVETLALIQARGFARRRKLMALWRKALSEHPRRLGSMRLRRGLRREPR